MKVVVDGLAWIPLDTLTEANVRNIRRALTIQPRATSDFDDGPPSPVLLYSQTDTHLGVPRGWFAINVTKPHTIVDMTSPGAGFSESLVSGGVTWNDDSVWHEQLAARDAVLGVYRGAPYGGCILQAGTGFGKTITALRVAHSLGVKTAVVVNKGFFTTQWSRRIQEFIPGAKIGIVQQNKCEYEDVDFSICMIHSLAKKRYPDGLYSAFGLVISDEVHRVGAASWSQVVQQFSAKYRLGLTATPRRKDGAEGVFQEHIGPIVYRAKTEAMIPKIKRVRTSPTLHGVRYGSKSVGVGELNMSQIEKQLSKDEFRNRVYADMVVSAVKAGRKPFVVSKYIEHLWDFEQLLRERFDQAGIDTTIGWVTGSVYALDEHGHRVKNQRSPGRGKPVYKTRTTKQDELDLAERAQVVLATQQMIEEGFDVQPLDVLVPLLPPSDIEQMAGRVRRWCKPKPEKCQAYCPWRAGECQGKKDPIILEPVDEGVPRLERRHERRMKFYNSLSGVK